MNEDEAKYLDEINEEEEEEEEIEENVGYIVKQDKGNRIHFCASCGHPIAIYGRLSPCLHAFCLICATDMHACFICESQINRIERLPNKPSLFISPLTLQTFKNEEGLQQHSIKAYNQLISSKEYLQFLKNMQIQDNTTSNTNTNVVKQSPFHPNQIN